MAAPYTMRLGTWVETFRVTSHMPDESPVESSTWALPSTPQGWINVGELGGVVHDAGAVRYRMPVPVPRAEGQAVDAPTAQVGGVTAAPEGWGAVRVNRRGVPDITENYVAWGTYEVNRTGKVPGTGSSDWRSLATETLDVVFEANAPDASAVPASISGPFALVFPLYDRPTVTVAPLGENGPAEHTFAAAAEGFDFTRGRAHFRVTPNGDGPYDVIVDTATVDFAGLLAALNAAAAPGVEFVDGASVGYSGRVAVQTTAVGDTATLAMEVLSNGDGGANSTGFSLGAYAEAMGGWLGVDHYFTTPAAGFDFSASPLSFDIAIDGAAPMGVLVDFDTVDLDGLAAALETATSGAGAHWFADVGDGVLNVYTASVEATSRIVITNVVDGDGTANVSGIVAIDEAAVGEPAFHPALLAPTGFDFTPQALAFDLVVSGGAAQPVRIAADVGDVAGLVAALEAATSGVAWGATAAGQLTLASDALGPSATVAISALSDGSEGNRSGVTALDIAGESNVWAEQSDPTVSWSFTGDGLPQAAWRAKVFPASRFNAAGFDPDTSTPSYDSGVVMSGATSWARPGLIKGVTYRAYVWAAQELPDSGLLHWDTDESTKALQGGAGYAEFRFNPPLDQPPPLDATTNVVRGQVTWDRTVVLRTNTSAQGVLWREWFSRWDVDPALLERGARLTDRELLVRAGAPDIDAEPLYTVGNVFDFLQPGAAEGVLAGPPPPPAGFAGYQPWRYHLVRFEPADPEATPRFVASWSAVGSREELDDEGNPYTAFYDAVVLRDPEDANVARIRTEDHGDHVAPVPIVVSVSLTDDPDAYRAVDLVPAVAGAYPRWDSF